MGLPILDQNKKILLKLSLKPHSNSKLPLFPDCILQLQEESPLLIKKRLMCRQQHLFLNLNLKFQEESVLKNGKQNAPYMKPKTSLFRLKTPSKMPKMETLPSQSSMKKNYKLLNLKKMKTTKTRKKDKRRRKKRKKIPLPSKNLPSFLHFSVKCNP